MKLNIKKTLQLLGCILGCLSIGSLGAIATASGVNSWYITINKPSFNPPNYLFGPVWTLLYLLMGVSIYLILQSPKNLKRNKAVIIFCLQLFLNLLWSFIFFKFQLLGIAFIEILMIWLSIIAMMMSFKSIHKTAAYLQLPYLLWVSFASVLNGSIWYLNTF
jgi:tryptophan-rich sensory protein